MSTEPSTDCSASWEKGIRLSSSIAIATVPFNYFRLSWISVANNEIDLAKEYQYSDVRPETDERGWFTLDENGDVEAFDLDAYTKWAVQNAGVTDAYKGNELKGIMAYNSEGMKNGYNRDFNEWIEKDIVNLVRRYRNDPSVVMWCTGNEVPDQGTGDGTKVCRMIQDIFHREDPTRPCTVGMDRVDLVLKNGFAHILDVPGLNYRSHKVQEAYNRLPQQVILGSETASTGLGYKAF